MKTKGYTLIEILGVVTLLGIILLVSIPMVIGTLKKQNEREYERFLGDIYMATEAYIQKNIDKYPELNIVNGKAYVYINELIESKLLKSTVYNPKKKEAIKNELDYTIIVKQDENIVYQYEFFEEKIIPCEYTINQEFIFNYTGNVQEFNPKCDGNYKLEVYGAQGGDISGYSGGRGGFSTGEKTLKKNKSLFITVGGAGNGATAAGQNLSGGYNGGGSVTGHPSANHICAAGGGATHISFLSGTLATIGQSNLNQIIIVAGGGGGARNQGNHEAAARWGNGGAGGGISGTGAQSSYGGTTLVVVSACAGTQTSGYSFGQGGSPTGQSGGGGGLYGGHSGAGGIGSCGYTGSGSGGSGYIEGLINATTSNGLRSSNGYAKITYLG